jgi:trans-aconitate methyltransferase
MEQQVYELTARLELEHWWFTGRRKILRALIHEIAPPSPEVTLLDIGCGPGGNTATLAEEYRCIGVDVSEQAIQAARRRFPRVRFVQGSWQDCLPAIGGQVDLFLLTDVLEHVPEDREMLSQVVAACRPGAHVLITVPADPRLWSWHDESHHHLRRYDRATLQALWEGLRVKPLLVSYYNSRLHPLMRLARRLGRRRARWHRDCGPDLWLLPRPVNRLLERIFAGESGVLLGYLKGTRRRGYSAGGSLIAILRGE